MPQYLSFGSGSPELFQCISQQAIAGSYKGSGRRFKRRRNERRKRQQLVEKTSPKPEDFG